MASPRRSLPPLTVFLVLLVLGGFSAVRVRAQTREVPAPPLSLALAIEQYGGPRTGLKVGDRVLLENSAGPLEVAVTLGEIKAVRPNGELVILETRTWYADGRDQALRRRVPMEAEPARFARPIQERLTRRAAVLEEVAVRTRRWLPAASATNLGGEGAH